MEQVQAPEETNVSDGECSSNYDYGSDDMEYDSDDDDNNSFQQENNNEYNNSFQQETNNDHNNNSFQQESNNEHNNNNNRSCEFVYRCYPLSWIAKTHLEDGNQIIMPESALNSLLTMNLTTYPMLFEIENKVNGRKSHCGVSEFIAEEGTLFFPNCLMKFMQIQPGDYINIKSTNLENGTYIKLQPHSVDFLASVPNPKAVLEENLGNKFFCLTTGDEIKIKYKNKIYDINVIETKPSSAISIINTDCELEFATPLDYKEPEKPKQVPAEKGNFVAFSGLSRRLDGKSCQWKEDITNAIRKRLDQKTNKEKEAFVETEYSKKKQFQPFTGTKYTLGG